uniref:Uncharacterized protein n=1 Tax=viral metagenome TaxID=1070528 RepID=A0A6M3J7W8_9ZZZZ
MPNPITLPPYLGDYLVDSTVYIYWNTFNSSNASVTLTGLAVTDIEIYKNASMTQRASDNGYTLIDTDGTDIDAATGCHGISIDLSDNSDAGFFARGSDYMVMVNAVTVDGQTVRFCAAIFSVENRAGRNGVGDYQVTLTIRTTGGTPVSGVSVWVNNTNSRSGSVAGTKVTDVNGQVIFNLEYTTYYIFCSLSRYSFAAASFTAASGSVAFTKDIATFLGAGAGASDFYADSFLTRAIADVRESTDEPTQKAKYTTARIIEHIERAYILVLNEINRNSRTPAVAKITKTIASGTTAYTLPHTVGSIHGIYKADESGGKIFYDSRSKYNPFGRGLWLENQTLHIQTTAIGGVGEEITIEYIPSGIARLHNGICTLNAAGTIVTFGATPNAGTLDTHHEAYAGSIFRCLGVDGNSITGNYLQERVITAYDETTQAATLDAALSPIPTTDDGSIYYEIAPCISKGMDTVVALYAAYRIVAGEGNAKRAASILKSYRNEIRNVRLTSYYSYMPEAPIDRSDSPNNRRYWRG